VGTSSPPSGSGSTASICRRRITAPMPSWRSGRWFTRLLSWPTKRAVTRNRVTSAATDIPPRLVTRAPATAIPASRTCSTTPELAMSRASTWITRSRRRCTSAESSARRRSANGRPRLVRRSSRAETASSKAAAWSVQAISSSTLRREISPRRGRTTSQATTPIAGKTTQAGHHMRPATTHIGTRPASTRPAVHRCRRSMPPMACVSSSTRSRISPDACSPSTWSGWRSTAVSRSLRRRPSARLTTPAHRNCPAVFAAASPTTATASRARVAAVGVSAIHPAMTVPTAPATAATRSPVRATTASGERRRRRSRRGDGSSGMGGRTGAAAGTPVAGSRVTEDIVRSVGRGGDAAPRLFGPGASRPPRGYT